MQELNLNSITETHKPSEAATFFIDFFNEPKAVAMLIRSQVPMYDGSLNPKWKYWDEVIDSCEKWERSQTAKGQRHILVFL